MSRIFSQFGLFLLALLLIAPLGCKRKEEEEPAPPVEPIQASADYSMAESVPLTQLKTSADFAEFITSSEIAVVKFTSSWCPPCQALTPELEKMAGYFATEGVAIGEVDVDANGALANEFNVSSIPHTFVFVNGQYYSDISGNDPDSINSLLNSVCQGQAAPASEPDAVEAGQVGQGAAQVEVEREVFADSEALDMPYLETREAFDAFCQENEFVAVKFGADWCGWCKVLEPKLRQIGGYYKEQGNILALAQVDSDKLEDLAEEQGVGGIPHTVFYRNGEKYGDVIGCDPPAIMAMLDLMFAGEPAPPADELDFDDEPIFIDDEPAVERESFDLDYVFDGDEEGAEETTEEVLEGFVEDADEGSDAAEDDDALDELDDLFGDEEDVEDPFADEEDAEEPGDESSDATEDVDALDDLFGDEEDVEDPFADEEDAEEPGDESSDATEDADALDELDDLFGDEEDAVDPFADDVDAEEPGDEAEALDDVFEEDAEGADAEALDDVFGEDE
jgi:thioredoxin-like negative regulator of GroEL